MADLPDYYTQAQISEAEAASLKGGLEANRPDDPVSRDIFLATDTIKLFYCVVDGAWLDITHACLLLAGGTMSGAIAMGTNKITGLGDPTANQDAATRIYVLAGLALKLALTGGTMSGNIAMGGNKVTGLGAPAAQDDALRYNRLEIRNNEIAAAAAIAYSKLALTGALKKGDIEAAAGIEYSKLALAASIVMADFAAAIQNAANGIVVLDASADVPDAQIPNLATSKTTSGRFPVDRLPALTDEMIWKGTGANPEEVAMPAPGFSNQRGTVAIFQAQAATGTCTFPAKINDNNTLSIANFTINEYAEIDFTSHVFLSKVRSWGSALMVGDGVFTLYAWDDKAAAYTAFTTIATQGGSWSDFENFDPVYTTKVRITATTMDTFTRNDISEIEIVGD